MILEKDFLFKKLIPDKYQPDMLNHFPFPTRKTIILVHSVFLTLILNAQVSKIPIINADQPSSQTITATQKITVDQAQSDVFEPDNSSDKASVIIPGVIQQHSIYPVEDIDYASFEARSISRISFMWVP